LLGVVVIGVTGTCLGTTVGDVTFPLRISTKEVVLEVEGDEKELDDDP